MTLQVFQFHKGTITTSPCDGGGVFHSNFNSIKVRLKLTPILQEKTLLFYFNSIKVRLKHVEGPDPLPYRDDEFQFHKGTIKTILLISKMKHFGISIP